MAVFIVPFSGVAVTAAQDVFEIVTGATYRVAIREIRLSQYSDMGSAQSEMISVTIHRGHTVAGSGGASVTPINTSPWTGITASTTAARNNTVVASGGSPSLLLADGMNVMAGWYYNWEKDERILVNQSERLVVRISAPSDELTMNGTLVFEELTR